MRHYVINASPVGLTRSIKKIVKAKIPDLHKYADISEFVLGANDLSDSEVEDTPESRVTLPQDFSGRGNKKSQKRYFFGSQSFNHSFPPF
jgi:ribosome biogenesis protein SSF1/2